MFPPSRLPFLNLCKQYHQTNWDQVFYWGHSHSVYHMDGSVFALFRQSPLHQWQQQLSVKWEVSIRICSGNRDKANRARGPASGISMTMSRLLVLTRSLELSKEQRINITQTQAMPLIPSMCMQPSIKKGEFSV